MPHLSRRNRSRFLGNVKRTRGHGTDAHKTHACIQPMRSNERISMVFKVLKERRMQPCKECPNAKECTLRGDALVELQNAMLVQQLLSGNTV
mmetsp:Transcript_42251/g.105238  ORF Transcript_42251/g.105238 Transcript_42251/m.105238 type:complete len:92 (+) Transcript_42251:28-303(+)